MWFSMRLWIVLLVTASTLACTPPYRRPADLRPEETPVRAGHEVVVEAGPSIRFLEVDGEDVDTTRLILAPGGHQLRYRVRKDLGSVSDFLQNVYHVGDCRFEIDTLRGFAYRVRLAGSQETGGRSSRNVKSIPRQIILENTVTGDRSALACELRFDCRRLRDDVTHSKYCERY